MSVTEGVETAALPVLSPTRRKTLEDRIQLALEGQPTPENRLGFLPPVDLYVLGEVYKDIVRPHLPEDMQKDRTTGLSTELNKLLSREYPREVRYAAYMLSRVWWALVWTVERQIVQTADGLWNTAGKHIRASERADFIGEARMAAYNAAIRWRPFRGAEIASLWPTFVKAGVRLYINTSGAYLTVHVCRVVRHAAEDYWQVRQWMQHQQKMGVSVTLEQAAVALGYNTPEAIQKLVDVHYSYQILRDQPAGSSEENPFDTLAAAEELPEDLVNRQKIYRVVDEAMQFLPPRERFIVEEQLAGRSMREIAAEISLSHERVRQIALAGLHHLHEYLLKSGIDEKSLEGLGGRQFQVGHLTA